jgi:hypothetical protein
MICDKCRKQEADIPFDPCTKTRLETIEKIQAFVKERKSILSQCDTKDIGLCVRNAAKMYELMEIGKKLESMKEEKNG